MPTIRYRLRGSWLGKVALAIALVVFGDVLFYQAGFSGGAFGFFGLAILGALTAAHPEVWRRKSSLIALALAASFALATIAAPSLLSWVMFWAASVMAVLLPRQTRFDDGWSWFQRLLGHAIFAVAGPLTDWRRVREVRRRRRSRQKLAILPLIILPTLGSAIFLWLFAAANPVIANWLSAITFPGLSLTSVVRLVLWITLLWLAWSVLRPRLTTAPIGLFDGQGELAIPGVSRISVFLSLVAFNAIFLLQNAMDAAWLWGILPLPQGISLAAYAHRGAYPLVATALLAALFVLVALRPGSQTAQARPIRGLVALWIAQNLFLVFNAAVRTMDYVSAYSLTVLRISALLWMLLVAVGLVLVLWRMLAGKSSAWLVNSNLAAAAGLLTVVCFVDLGAMAAWWNVRHAREIDGNGARIDLCYLNRLGASALLPLLELERRPLSPQLHAQTRKVRMTVQQRLAGQIAAGGWSWLNARRLARAERLSGTIIHAPRYRYGMRCDGRPYPPPATTARAASVPEPVRPSRLSGTPALTEAGER